MMRRLSSGKRLITCMTGCLLLVFVAVSMAKGQKVNSRLPSVYLTFSGFVKRIGDATHQLEGARLVLHNNTRWPIIYREWLDPVLSGDVPMGYTVELADGSFTGRKHVDVVTSGTLLPGKTVSFVVPKEDLPEASKVYVEFEFSWELDEGKTVTDEVVHRAYFRSRDLPTWPKAEK